MCVSLQRRACKSMAMYVSLQWRVQNVWGMGGGGGDHTMGGGGGNTGHGTIYTYSLSRRWDWNICNFTINVNHSWIGKNWSSAKPRRFRLGSLDSPSSSFRWNFLHPGIILATYLGVSWHDSNIRSTWSYVQNLPFIYKFKWLIIFLVALLPWIGHLIPRPSEIRVPNGSELGCH